MVLFRLTALTLALSFLFTACVAAPAPAPAPAAPAAPAAEKPAAAPAAAAAQVCKIGLLDAMTGDSAVWGQSDQKGAQMAVDEINKAGGVGGAMKLELVTEDNRMAPADSVTGFKKLAEVDKVPVVVGVSGSTISFSTCPETAKYKIVAMTANATNPNLGPKCPPYFYRMMPSDAAQGPEMVKVLEYFKQTDVPILYINNDYGIGVRDAVVNEMKAKGYKPTLVQPFEWKATDFRTELLKVKELNPKAAVLIGYVEEIGLMLKQAKEMGIQTQWVGEVDAVTKEVPEIAGAGAEGFVALYPGSRLTDEYKKFADAFQAKYNTAPTVWAEFAYDAVKLAAMAMEKAGNVCTGDAIQQNLRQVSDKYVGPSGPKQFLPEDNVVHPFYEWDIVKDGKWVIFEKK
jgi:branched-chain amino acid transport system substrate-binding protein